MKPLLIIVAGGTILFLAGLGGGSYLALSKGRELALELARARAETQASSHAEAARAAEEAEQAELRQPEALPPDAQRLQRVARELQRWSAEVQGREQRAAAREEALAEREDLLRRERAALDARREELVAFQERVRSQIILIERAEEQNLQNLAELLDGMGVDQVVATLRSQPDDRNARLLAQMKARRVVRLLESWTTAHPSDRARVLQLFQSMRVVMREADVDPAGEQPAATPEPPPADAAADATPAAADAASPPPVASTTPAPAHR